MIKIENVVVSGWEAAIRGMRNPMNSWMKSDSHVCTEETANDYICPMVDNGHTPCVCNDGEYGYLPYSEVITGERDAQAPEADGART